MCSMSTFYTSPYGLTEVLTRTSMLITELYTNPKIYSFAEYLSNGLAVYAPLRFLIAHRFAHRFTLQSGLTDRSQLIRFSACTADPANVALVSQHFSTRNVCDYGYNGISKTKDVDDGNSGSRDNDDGNSRSKGDDEDG